MSQYSCSGYTEPSTGGLVGTNWGTIAECHADVEVTGQKSVGGLVGDNLGTIADSHAEGSVTGHRYGQYVGGLVGSNRLGSQGRRGRGDILRCWATSDVTSGDDSRWVGGLVGHNTGLVSLSYARGTVRGGDSTASYYQSFSPGTGGLVGFNAGDVTYCYATGAVSGYDNVGGLVGYNSDEVYAWLTKMTTGAIRDCYATGKVTSWMLSEPVTDIPEAPHVGGLIGGDYGQLRNGYFLDPNDAGGFDSGWGTALRDTQMRTQASFAGWDFVGETTDGTEDIWTICEGVDYPRLWWEDRGCPGR